MEREEFKKALDGALKFFPGIKIKPEQELCLESLVVKRKDVLGVLPTGYGKSLIYQLLPKLMSEYWFHKTGTKKTISVLVVSPLELIRQQQVERLNISGVKATLLEDLRCEDLKEIEIVFGSAEQWLSEKWRSSLKSGNFKDAEFLVVDEVHTVETWGTGKKGKAAFRQAFGQVKDLRSFLGRKPVLALTATADKDMRKRLCKLLGFKDHKEVLISPNKENIRFTVTEADKRLTCLDWLVTLLKSKREDSPFAIIFCHTVSDIVLVLSTLLMKLGDDAYLDGPEPPPDRCLLGVYYSATPDNVKARISSAFSGNGKARVVIASTSLSMGVDFPHVKYVIHFGPGRSLTDHLQQAGRAGRDSKQAFNIILYQGKHLSQCERAVKDVVRSEECVRRLLLCHFTDEDLSLAVQHNCCNRCHSICNCGGQNCSTPYFDFDQMSNNPTEESQGTREVSTEDKQCLEDALHEVQLSLDLSSGLTLFDSSGVITHGFSDNVVEAIVENCAKIFNINDLMECGFISSLNIAIIVLEVFNEVFEDIVIDDNLYELSVVSGSVYQTFLNANFVCDDNDHDLELLSSDSEY